MDNRTFVSEEKHQTLERKIRELETTLDSMQKDRDSYRASTRDKENYIVDLQYKLMEIEEEKLLLLNDLNKQKIVSKKVTNRIRGWESSLQSVNMEHKSKENYGQGKENVKGNCLFEKIEPNTS